MLVVIASKQGHCMFSGVRCGDWLQRQDPVKFLMRREFLDSLLIGSRNVANQDLSLVSWIIVS